MKLTLTGKRTLLCCLVIIVLALCQRFFGVKVPSEIWIGLFAIALAFLRLGLPPGAAGCLIPLGAALVAAGCITVNNNVGDYAVRVAAASNGVAQLDATNSVHAVQGTNSADTAAAVRLRGGLIISTTVNKNVSPSTDTALSYVP